MPTKHNPPKPTRGEPTKKGRPAKRSGRPAGRQRAVDIERLRRVAKEMLAGKDYNEMQRELAAEWNVTMRTIRGYRARVLEDMQEQLEEAGYLDPGLERILGVSRLEMVFAGAVADKDWRTAMHIVKTRMLVAGAMSPKQHVHTFAPAAPGAAPVQVAVTVAAATPYDAAKLELARKLIRKAHKEPALPPAERPDR